MRKTSAALAALSLALVALTGCTTAPQFNGAACERGSAASGLGESVTVTGDVGDKPDVEIFTPVKAKKTAFEDVVVGDGPALSLGSQPMVIEFALYRGDTGEQFFSTPFDGDLSRVNTITGWAEQLPPLATALECATGGTRTIAAITAKDFGAQNAAAFELDPDAPVIAVIDVVKAHLPHAEGAALFQDARGLPSVVRAADGRPGIIVPNVAAPKSQVVETLIQGEGEKVTKDSTVWVNFTAVGWDDKKVLTSTWDQQAISNLASQAAPAAEALVGQTVGSQVMVILPGANDQQAVVLVIDILGTSPAATR